MEAGKHTRKASLKLISEMTGYSTATISNALNHKRGVNQETASEIFRVAKELGYIEEDAITKIRIIIFKKNGMIIDDTPFFSLMIDGIEKECRAQGLEILLNHLSQNDSDYVEQARWMIHDNTSAIIILGTELFDQDIELYKRASCPLLTLDFWCNDMSLNGVLINNSDSARMAVEYLISKGHKEIGYLRGGFRIKAFQERSVGYRQALKQAELPINSEYMITLGTTNTGAYHDMIEHLHKNPKLPTAFFADNDIIALGAMKALLEMGYQVPDDISLVGFDDLPYSEISTPPLTTLRVPKQDMGKLAVRRLMEMMREDSKTRTKIQVCTHFVERQSVKDLTRNEAVPYGKTV